MFHELFHMDKGTENLFKKGVDENFPNLWEKNTNPQSQEANRTPGYLSPKKPFPRHILLKLSKMNNKERIPKAAKEKKKVTYKGKPLGYHQTSQQELHKPEESGAKYSNYEKEITSQE